MADGKRGDFNPIMAVNFVEWMHDELLFGQDADHWSPAMRQAETLEPIFPKVFRTTKEDERYEPLDPLRLVGVDVPIAHQPQPLPDEVERCSWEYPRGGVGKCWCGRKAGIRKI